MAVSQREVMKLVAETFGQLYSVTAVYPGRRNRWTLCGLIIKGIGEYMEIPIHSCRTLAELYDSIQANADNPYWGRFGNRVRAATDKRMARGRSEAK